MHFSKPSQGSKWAITMRPVSIESFMLLFFLIKNFLGPSIFLMQKRNHAVLRCSEKSNFKQKVSARVAQRKIKSSPRKYVRGTQFRFWPMENIFQTYKPIKIFTYKTTENNCWVLRAISSQRIYCKLNKGLHHWCLTDS